MPGPNRQSEKDQTRKLLKICPETITAEGYGLQPVRYALILISGFSRRGNAIFWKNSFGR
jgi:hypothetical protein